MVGPKCLHKCPHDREAGGDLDKRRRYVQMESEVSGVGVMVDFVWQFGCATGHPVPWSDVILGVYVRGVSG